MNKSMDSIQPLVPVRNADAIESTYITEARRKYAEPTDDIEIDDYPKVSTAENGAWVSAWVWVTQDDANVDKEALAQGCIS